MVQGKKPRYQSFQGDFKNKEELFDFLSNRVSTCDCPSNKEIYITSGKFSQNNYKLHYYTLYIYACSHVFYYSFTGSSVVSRSPTPMVQCDHEEADTRIAIHIEDSLRNGARTILVRTVDTDLSSKLLILV